MSYGLAFFSETENLPLKNGRLKFELVPLKQGFLHIRDQLNYPEYVIHSKNKCILNERFFDLVSKIKNKDILFCYYLLKHREGIKEISYKFKNYPLYFPVDKIIEIDVVYTLK